MAKTEAPRSLLDDNLITVTMDAGVYRWLMETIEARSHDRSYGWVEWYKQLVDRAKEQFEAAGQEQDNGDELPTTKRLVRRRVAKTGESG